MIGIYKITSPSGKIYIGQSVNIEKRFRQYKNYKCKEQIRLYRSLNKYTVEKHIFEVIEKCNIEELNERERYWQIFYNCIGKNGLNCQITNDKESKRILSNETKNKMKKSRKELFKKNPELNNIYRNRMIEKYRNGYINPRKGKKLSEETKKKLRDANIGSKCEKRQGFNHFNSKIVLCLETGIFYGSAKQASIAYNLNYCTLKDNLNGRRNIKNKTSLIYV